jgi:hypothetical protein
MDSRRMPMRTLSELAETYEKWAAEADILADQVMKALNIQRKELQVKQMESAQMFLGEAERLRQMAARLRANWRPQTPVRKRR